MSRKNLLLRAAPEICYQVHGKHVLAARQRPDMQVVNFDDARHRLQRIFYLLQIHAPRNALQKYVEHVLEQNPRSRNDP